MNTATVTLYTKAGCPQCVATKRALDDRQISYQIVDLDTNPAALLYVKDLGHLAAPVVQYGPRSFSGFRPDLISELAHTLAGA